MLNNEYMLNDEELNNVTGGMKIIVIKSPKPDHLSALLKILFPIRKKPV